MANAGPKNTTIQKQGTSLVQTSDEELKKLAQQAGFNPTSPLGAKAIGANPDQAKMTGTPAQKQSVLDVQAAPRRHCNKLPALPLNRQKPLLWSRLPTSWRE